MACPSVHGDNLRALASGLSNVQVENMVYIVTTFFTTYISVYPAHHEIFRAQVSEGGLSNFFPIVKCLASRNTVFSGH